MAPYDWKRTLYKAGKTAAVAGVAYLLADPGLQVALMDAIPASYRPLVVIALPTVISAIRNWMKAGAQVIG